MKNRNSIAKEIARELRFGNQLKFSHTPGPWHFNPNGEICGANNWVVAQIDGYGGKTRQNIANAKIISAAPEILLALTACKLELERLSPTASKDAIELAAKAIIKAGGNGNA